MRKYVQYQLLLHGMLNTGLLDNARVFDGLAIMGYDPLYHALQIW